MNTVKIHTSKDKTWTNASGDPVPFKYVPAPDKHKETLAGKLRKLALNVEASLNALYKDMDDAFSEIQAAINKEYEVKGKERKKGLKGSLTWYNFDRSIKVESNKNELVKWDKALMEEALTCLNKYLSSGLSDANILINKLVESAFANSKGQIDTGKVFQILKYRGDIKNANFQKACDLITKAQSLDKTKLYMSIYEKIDTGEYRLINLNFSSI